MKKLGFNVTAPFPGKKAFGRFGDEFLVTRHKMLNAWLRALLDIRAPVGAAVSAVVVPFPFGILSCCFYRTRALAMTFACS